MSQILVCDTEFTSFTQRQLISIALVGLRAESFYALATDYAPEACSDFVRENVLPRAAEGQPITGRQAEIAEALDAWIAPWLADGITIVCDSFHDQGLLEGLMGGRASWSRITIEIMDPLLEPEGSAAYAAHFERVGWDMEHHALHDAIALAAAFRDALAQHGRASFRPGPPGGGGNAL